MPMHCDFCQMWHSASSCSHPGRARLAAVEAERDDFKRMLGRAEGAAGSYVQATIDHAAKLQARVTELEAQIAALQSPAISPAIGGRWVTQDYFATHPAPDGCWHEHQTHTTAGWRCDSCGKLEPPRG